MPLNKLTNVKLKSFLEELRGQSILDQTTLRKTYVHELYTDTIQILQKKATGAKLWVSIDETTDVEQRYVACYVFGVLG